MAKTDVSRGILGVLVNVKTILAAVIFIAGAFVGGALAGGHDAGVDPQRIERCLPLMTTEQLRHCVDGSMQ